MRRVALFLALAALLLGGLLPGPASGQTGPTIELTVGSETVLEEGGPPIKVSYTARNFAYATDLVMRPRGGTTLTDVAVYEQATAPGPGDSPVTLTTYSGDPNFYYTVAEKPDAVVPEQTGTLWITAVAEDPPVREAGEQVEVYFDMWGRHGVTNQQLSSTVQTTVVTFTLADPPSVPEAPTGVTAEEGDGQVLLSWDVASDRTHTRYEYRQSADGGTTWAPDWTAVPESGSGGVNNEGYRVTGLSTGTTYTFEVRRVNDYDANNAEDLGPAGSVEATPTAGGVAPPSGLAAEAGNGQVWLTWMDPQDATIVGYDYQQWQTGGRWSAWTAMDWTVVPRVQQSATRYRVMGLDNDVAYRFRVRARTGAGATSLPAAGVAATPRAVVPAQPTGLTARAGLGVVVLTWADPGDASIQRYEYRQQTGTGPAGVWVNLPADSSGSARTTRHEVTGLASGTPYTFRVRAVNAAGASPASAAVTVTPRHRPPAPPANVVVTPVRNQGGQFVDVYWADPGDPTITRTEYSLDHGRTWQPLTPNTESTGPRGEGRGQVRLGLTANLDYTLRVRFVNAAGPGDPSEPVRFYNGWRGVLPPSPHQDPPTYPNTAFVISRSGSNGDLGSHPRNDHGRAEFERRTGTLTLRWMPGADTGKGPEVVYWRVRFTDELGLADPDPAPVPPTDVTLPLGVTSYTVRLPDPAVVPAGARGSIAVDVCVRATDLCYVFVHGDYQIPGLPEEEDPYPGPTNVRAVEGDGQITLTWDPPVRGTASITKYQYNVILAGADQWMDVPDGPDADTEASNERTVTVTGLTNGGGMRPGREGQYPYFCDLRAVRVVEGRTEEGEKVQCGEKQLLYPRAAGVPQRPAGLTLWASGRTGGELLLTWADPGDGTLTGYEYRGGSLVPPAADWTPLPNSDAHTTQARFGFTVGGGHHGPPTGIVMELLAVNANGAGTDDGLDMPFTQFQAPARPTGLTATPAGPGQVTLRWAAPPPTVRTRTQRVVEAAFLGPLITGHRYTTDGGTTWHEIPASATGEAHATTYTVAGLPNGQAVTFHLLASNDEGASPVSEPVMATPQAVVPQAPTGVQARTAATAVTLTWAAAGDASLTGYEVQQGSGAWSPVPDGPDEDTTAGNERAQTVTGLTTGTAYTFRVRARNAVGVSPASAAVTATPGLPNAPTGVRAVPGDAAVTLTWADPGDASVTGYEVQQGGGAWTPVEGSDATTVTEAISGLTNGVAYTFRVRARTAVGPGPAAAAVTATPVHPNAPQVPRGFRANPLPGRVTLTWLEPENGNHLVTRYEYRQRADAGATWAPDWTPVPESGLAADGTPEANRLSYTLPGLANGQALRVQLRGQNAHGAGPAAQATATPSADAGQVVITSEEFEIFEAGARRELTTPTGQTYTLIIRHDVPAD